MAIAAVPEGRSACPPARAAQLPLARYVFKFRATQPVVFPAHSGSAWRGVLGHALRRTVCVTRAPSCTGCLLAASCAYPYVFETAPPPGSAKMRRYALVPHPYVLQTDATGGRAFPVGAELELGLVLVGRANAHLPYLVHALASGAQRGIGRSRASLELCAVEQYDADGPACIYRPGEALAARAPTAPIVPQAPAAARIVVHTPLRLKRGEHLVRPESFQFADLFSALLRRVSMLSYFHTDSPLEADFAGLVRAARAVRGCNADLHWREWTRYSSRQKTEMQMGGVVGEIRLDANDWSPFWPVLWLGQWVHAGKGATMGLGRYTIEPIQACEV